MKRSSVVNPYYDMDVTLQRNINNHLDQLFKNHSKILMLRVDFAYRKDSHEFSCQDIHGITADMVQLLIEIKNIKGLSGYIWVLEQTQTHGLHIHAAFYLNGQIRSKVWPTFAEICNRWEVITRGEGYAHRCEPKEHYFIRGEQIIDYRNHKGIAGMKYILSYLAKQNQKENGRVYGVSSLPERSVRGRRRHY
ncbi:YagK/YfjJ domain-containing protein [Yersinia pseudotuberculosis]|uniref:Inovirus Gp2 family protein n=1 Tax=Yersinia pseudotuberculosis TaxID=633 RepID=A0ABM7AHJ3_YERPU|nr:inovirus-type Gp2 protein [Yersinia pseudotuberculosis]AYW92009.1 inovirus Gp2 family protein [Yersinia pseudotuberculosis]